MIRESSCITVIHHPPLAAQLLTGCLTLVIIAKAANISSGKCEMIYTGTDKRYVCGDENGDFKESDDLSRALAQDVKKNDKKASKPGQGDKEDQKRKK